MSDSIRVEVRRHSAAHPWTYRDLDSRQRQIAAEVREGAPGAILLSELAPVITCGRRTEPGDILHSEEDLHARGIGLFRTDRGGLATYHGPGQWVLFVVDRLDRLTGDPRGVRRAVDGLLQVAHAIGQSHESGAEIRTGCELGVWGPHGKFAAVGVQIEQGVLLHGLSINAFRTPQSFFGLRPCGLDAPVGFLLSNDSGSLDAEFQAMGERILTETRRTFWKI